MSIVEPVVRLKPNHACWKQLCATCKAYVDHLDHYRAADLRAEELEAERDEARAQLAARDHEFSTLKIRLDERIRELEQALRDR